MNTLKTILVVSITFFTTTFSTLQTQEKDGYYYFAYAQLYTVNADGVKLSGSYVFTNVMFISNNDCKNLSHRSDNGLHLQFNDYMKAEYNDTYDIDVVWLSSSNTSKAEAVKTRRTRMAYAKKITKVDDFEYLCDN